MRKETFVRREEAAAWTTQDLLVPRSGRERVEGEGQTLFCLPMGVSVRPNRTERPRVIAPATNRDSASNHRTFADRHPREQSSTTSEIDEVESVGAADGDDLGAPQASAIKRREARNDPIVDRGISVIRSVERISIAAPHHSADLLESDVNQARHRAP